MTLTADRTPLRADGNDLVFVTADIRDAGDVLVPTASPALTFSVSGAGTLVGLDNGDPTDTASYKGSTRKAFSGKALAIVRSNGKSGAITINASSSGLTASSITVTAQ